MDNAYRLPAGLMDLVDTGGAASVFLSEQVVDYPLLNGLTEDEIARVFACGRRIEVGDGEHVFRQGEPHRGVFVIVSGVVRTYYLAPNGREITLALWRVGNFVGGPELFGGGEHVWSGAAHGPAVTLAVSGGELRRLAEDIPRLAVNLLDGLVAKGRCYSLALQMLGTRSVVQRLAHLLLVLGGHDFDGDARGPLTLRRRLSHEEIASIVGATRQWVSAAIGRFRKSGVIAVDADRTMRIVRPAELVRIALE